MLFSILYTPPERVHPRVLACHELRTPSLVVGATLNSHCVRSVAWCDGATVGRRISDQEVAGSS